MTTAITGGCFCKTIQYRIYAPIAMAVNCHCNACKKASGAAFSSLAIIREKRFEIVSGLDDLTKFQLGDSLTKHFCRYCGTPVFNLNGRYPGRCMVSIGSLDNPSIVSPSANIHCENTLNWVRLDSETKNFEKDYR